MTEACHQHSVCGTETQPYAPPEKIQVTFPVLALIWNESGTVTYSGDLQSVDDVIGWSDSECSMFITHEGRHYTVSTCIEEDGNVYAYLLPIDSYK
jgi:hypothetical protein